jgi:peroxiredoxin
LAEESGKFREAGVGLVAISVDSRQESAALAEKLGIGFPLLQDEGLATALAYGVAMEGKDIAIPATFVVGRDRSIAWKRVGESVTDRPDVDEVLEVARRLR